MMRISQTMIVKNEENNIESALNWGKDILFEQIVVDTGSTDRTVEIAEKMGAKVLFFKWIDDFSAAKNYAIDNCKGEWIVILDADEYFLKEDVVKLIGIIEKADKEGCYAVETGLINIDGMGGILSKTTQIRILKNIKEVRYSRRIHETLKFSSRSKIFDAVNELNIIHTGYIEETAKRKNSSGRNKKLLLKEYESNPKDPEIIGYLADEYAMSDDQGEKDKAIELYKKAIMYLPAGIDKDDARAADTFIKLIVLLGLKNKTDDIKEFCRMAEEKMPENADFSYYAGLHFYNNKDYVTAFNYYKTAFEKQERNSRNNSGFLAGNIFLAYAQYGHILLELKDLKGAVTVESSVLKENKKEYLALITILKAFKSSGVTDQMATDYLKKIYDFSKSLDKLLLYKAAVESGYEGIRENIAELLDDKEKLIVENGL